MAAKNIISKSFLSMAPEETKFNTFTLKVRTLDLENVDADRSAGFYVPAGGATALEIELYIDGCRIGREGFVNIQALWLGLHTDIDGKTSYMFNCGCGEPSCAGIESCIGVTHEGDHVIWKFAREFSNWAGFPATANEVVLKFRRKDLLNQYQQAWQEILRSANDRMDRVRLPIHDDVLAHLVNRCAGLVPR